MPIPETLVGVEPGSYSEISFGTNLRTDTFRNCYLTNDCICIGHHV